MDQNNNILKIKNGGKEAFKLFYLDYFPIYVSFALKYLDDKYAAEDLVQDSFASLWEVRKNIDNHIAIKSYLYTTVRNKCLNRLRELAIRNKNVQSEFTEVFFRDNLIEEETYSIIYRAINELPDRTRQVILYGLSGLKNNEIASQMNITVNTVTTLKKRAYKKLHDKLKNHLALLLIFAIFYLLTFYKVVI